MVKPRKNVLESLEGKSTTQSRIFYLVKSSFKSESKTESISDRKRYQTDKITSQKLFLKGPLKTLFRKQEIESKRNSDVKKTV